MATANDEQDRKSGVEIAYLVAIALGLHSIGEGLGIGVSYVMGDTATLTLLVLAFVMHNVMEGPTVVAAIARDRATPPLRHFVAIGVIAGGPVIVGGWIGSFAQSDLLAILFYAVAIGAILQVLIEVAELIRFDADAVLTRANTMAFAFGFVLMFLLEDVLTEVLLEGGSFPPDRLELVDQRHEEKRLTVFGPKDRTPKTNLAHPSGLRKSITNISPCHQSN